MKIFTFTGKPKSVTPYLLFILLLFVFISISCAETPTDSLKKDSQKYLSFYETVDGEQIHWEVNFFGDEIASIYKNGKRIPDDLTADYKDKVYDQLDEMRSGSTKFSFKMRSPLGDDFQIDMDKLHKELEEMKKNLPGHKEQFGSFKFDNEEFKKDMEKFQKELRELNLDEFKKQMEELEKNLKENMPKLEKFKFKFELEEEDTEV
jgi:chromosome segregation ATPase